MGKTMPILPQRPKHPKRDMYPFSDSWYKGFSAFMICAITLFIAVMIAMCIQFG